MENDSSATGDVVYVPAPPDMHTYESLGHMTVDGETFAVRRRDGGSTLLDAIDYDWISGPNDGYGFSSLGISGPVSVSQHTASIREFLRGIDRATGYLAHP